MNINTKSTMAKAKLTEEKLFSIFPWVLFVNTRNAEIASVQHATSDMAVDICVTFANRSSVGVRRLP